LVCESRKAVAMKALVFKSYGGLDQVALVDAPRPTPKPHEILVRVHAAGLNPIDNKIRSGEMKPILKFQLPATQGSDLAGTVAEVGSQVTRFKVGDAIFANIFGLPTGALAEFATVPESAAALKPANLDFVQSASVPMVALTSWQVLEEKMGLRAGQKVFIPAGAGGIGTFAIQLAKHLGAEVATTASAGKLELVKELGADVVIDYHKQNFEDVLRDYDGVFDTLGGESQAKSFQILRPQGLVISIVGPPDARFARSRGMNPLLVLVMGLLSRKANRLAKARGAAYEFLFMHPDGARLAHVGGLLNDGRIRPVIDKAFPFGQAKEALAYLEKGRATGKVVVQMD
jgi:NADPH:quinone reductase-like Zn-dependent oxidoreductase